MLWPDSEPAQARNNLRKRLHQLRKLAGGDVVINARDRLAMADGTTADTEHFDNALGVDPNAGAGDLLGTLDYQDLEELHAWVDAARQRWRNHRFERLAARASELEAHSEIAAALVLAHRMVVDDPLHEHNHRRLMRLHYLRGDRAAALVAYQACRDQLRIELGALPATETVQLASIIEDSGALEHAVSMPRPVAVLRPPRLVGRALPWQALTQAWESNAALVVLLGEPGIGKSRLLNDFCTAHKVSLSTAALAGDATVPYALLSRLLTQLGAHFAAPMEAWARSELARWAPSLGQTPPHAFQRVQLIQAMQHALAQWHGSGVNSIAIDDLHFADTATLELLPALAAAPIRWLVALRTPVGATSGTDMADTSVWPLSLEPKACRRIELGPLDEENLAQLIGDLGLPLDPARWAPRLLQHAGGNPLFVLETLLCIASADVALPQADPAHLPLPPDVTTLIAQRLVALDPNARRLAYLAALAGQDFTADLAARLLKVHVLDLALPLRTLERNRVLLGNEFTHDLVRETLRQEVPAVIARALHRDLAIELDRMGSAAARIAEHWDAAGEAGPAAAAWQRAATAANAAQRPNEAMAMLEHAARNFEATGDHEGHFLALLAQCDAAEMAAQWTLAAPLARSLLALARGAREAALAHEQLGRIEDAGTEFHAVLASYRAGMAAAQEAQDDHLFNRLAYRAGLLRVALEGPEAGLAALQALLPWVHGLLNPVERLTRLSEFGLALNVAGQRIRARTVFLQCLDQAEKQRDHSSIADLTMMLASADLRLGAIESAARWSRRAWQTRLQLAGRADATCMQEVIFLAPTLRTLGCYREALQLLEPLAKHLSESSDVMASFICAHLAQVWLHLAQPARARQALGPRPQGSVPLLAWLRVNAQLSTKSQAAIACHRQIEKLAQESQMTEQALQANFDLALVAPDTQTPAQIRRWCQECVQRELFALALHGRLALVHVLLSLPEPNEAAAEARVLLADLQTQGSNALYRPQLFLSAHDAFNEAGDRVAATQAAAAGARWIRAVATDQIDPAFVDAFVHRSAVNRRLLTLASAAGMETDHHR